MKQIFLLASMALVTCACTISTEQSANGQQPSADTMDTDGREADRFYKRFDTQLRAYMSKLNVDTTMAEKPIALYDRMEKTDSATYAVFHIGHDVVDEGGGKRFATDGWLYVDTLTAVAYDYDLVEDRLIIIGK